MKLHCPDCGAAIPAADMNLASLVAKCAACDSVFSFAGVAVPTPASATRVPAAPVQAAPQPPQMKVEQLGNNWRVTWRWFTPEVAFLLFFACCWDGFLVFWYVMAFTTNGPLAMKLFPILHVAVGVLVTYLAITGLLNRTTIDVSRSQVLVRHRPLPWAGNRSVPSAEIQQLYCEESGVKQNGASRYRVCVSLGNGRRFTLVTGFKSLAEARYLEQTIESRLNIKPQAVPGECA